MPSKRSVRRKRSSSASSLRAKYIRALKIAAKKAKTQKSYNKIMRMIKALRPNGRRHSKRIRRTSKKSSRRSTSKTSRPKKRRSNQYTRRYKRIKRKYGSYTSPYLTSTGRVINRRYAGSKPGGYIPSYQHQGILPALGFTPSVVEGPVATHGVPRAEGQWGWGFPDWRSSSRAPEGFHVSTESGFGSTESRGRSRSGSKSPVEIYNQPSSVIELENQIKNMLAEESP